MGTRVTVQQILRQTVKNVPISTFIPVRLKAFKRPRLQPLCLSCRLFCFASDRTSSPLPQHNHSLSPDLSLRSLLDMGFTESQARQICDSVFREKGANAAKHVLSTLTVLFVLGLNPTSVLKLLDKCPELCTVKETQLQQRINHLRKLGLVEGSLQRMVVHYPKILTVPVKSVKNVVQFLRKNCQFTSQQVTETLRDSPAVVLEDLAQLEYKFQYVYFRMGVKQAEMVKCRLFRFTLDDVRCRHSFLERRGLYQTPDKKGQTTIINPKLDSILNVDREMFIADVARASAEEYDVFQKLLAREWKEEELEHCSIKAYSDDDDDYDDDDDEEEEEETGGKSGYKKKKKNK
ncbi:transcription termination factor 4, mitochondrial [Girardinichthys multiradiatus]|uniref:transcription termination factor 4, mitochondrial n=1 Tax=Girardinichthys multiradiatus TaxID=208333 RepID=UPI001FAC3813|nr:transcription termination factor 4, mitochondrial [Girardinichthys multiradiatus]